MGFELDPLNLLVNTIVGSTTMTTFSSPSSNSATPATIAAPTTAEPDRNVIKHEVPIDPETGKPYINTVAAVAIAPSGVGAELSEYVSQSVAVIRNSGLTNDTNAMFTNIEGNLDDVLRVVRDASMVLASQGYRTGVTLKLDIRPGFTDQLAEKPKLVDQLLDSSSSNTDARTDTD